MTADTALRLERWLGAVGTVPCACPAFWMNLQKRYELDIARAKVGDTLSMIEPIHHANHQGRQWLH